MTTGSLALACVGERLDLVAAPVAALLATWPLAGDVRVAEIDPSLADTMALCNTYGVEPAVCGNCVVVSGARAGVTRYAAAVVLATTRADVNTVVRKHLDVRKCSFAPMDEAVERTGMEYGGITPLGLPSDMPVLVDAAVAVLPEVVVGSGIRASKLVLPGEALAALPGAVVIEGLGR